jgi:hypothetical protein
MAHHMTTNSTPITTQYPLDPRRSIKAGPLLDYDEGQSDTLFCLEAEAG